MFIILLFYLLNFWYGGFKNYTFNNNYISCSFEYPVSLSIAHVDKGSDESPVAIVYFSPIQLKNQDDLSIALYILKKDLVYRSYSAYLDRDISSFQNSSFKDELIVINRDNITIDGIAYEKLIYSYFRQNVPIYKNDKLVLPDKIPAISYNAYFENNGFLGKISVDAKIKKSEQAKSDFEHLIDSFKFLD
jgi:hypothetical protein